jgi:hypothetical protein
MLVAITMKRGITIEDDEWTTEFFLLVMASAYKAILFNVILLY